jgi:hypothetical protein
MFDPRIAIFSRPINEKRSLLISALSFQNYTPRGRISNPPANGGTPFDAQVSHCVVFSRIRSHPPNRHLILSGNEAQLAKAKMNDAQIRARHG